MVVLVQGRRRRRFFIPVASFSNDDPHRDLPPPPTRCASIIGMRSHVVSQVWPRSCDENETELINRDLGVLFEILVGRYISR